MSLGDDPERVANAFREQMGVSADHQTEWPDEYAALSAWREALYALGVLTLQFPLPLSDARGFSMYDSRFSVIGVSTRDAVPARIFSIFHELCHLCLRQPGVSAVPTDFRVRHADSRSDIEQFCNRFASGVLLPLDDPTVQNHLVKAAQGGKDEDADIRWAAKRLKVSKYVLLRRLVAAGYRAESDYRRWAAIWNIQAAAYVPPVHKTGGPGPVTISMSRRGRDFSQLVFAALDMGRISLRQASRYLSLDPGKFGQARSRLFSGTASE
ncbi:MAG: ImmA/IrrE family metallo-endopeptidase [Armatimonadota bacterium]|nr:ImmA/IrrE family metallo-endopeptidase [Armatimonadota bacterium]